MEKRKRKIVLLLQWQSESNERTSQTVHGSVHRSSVGCVATVRRGVTWRLVSWSNENERERWGVLTPGGRRIRGVRRTGLTSVDCRPCFLLHRKFVQWNFCETQAWREYAYASLCFDRRGIIDDDWNTKRNSDRAIEAWWKWKALSYNWANEKRQCDLSLRRSVWTEIRIRESFCTLQQWEFDR